MRKISLIILVIGALVLIAPVLIGGYSSLLLIPVGGVLIALGLLLLVSSLIIPHKQVTPTGSSQPYTQTRRPPIAAIVFLASFLLFLSYFATIPALYQAPGEQSIGLTLLWALPLGTSIALYILAIILRVKSRQ